MKLSIAQKFAIQSNCSENGLTKEKASPDAK